MLEYFDTEKSITAVIVLVIVAFLLLSFILIKAEVVNRNKFSSTKSEDKLLFGKYNNDYKPKVTSEEDGRLVVVDIDAQKYGGRGNKAIVNYISNVGGKLLSVNGVDVEGDRGRLHPIAIPGTSGMGMMRIGREEEKKRNVFVILVPKDASVADNLEERIRLYAKYSK